VIPINGTIVKTSFALFIAQCMDAENARCGVLGTLGNGFLDDLTTTGLTTADVLSVHRDLEILRANGASHVVMEVSSHGLDQGRVNGVHFDTAVFTNLSHEHLDYHETMTAYAEVKRKLFFMPGLQTAVINLDDEYGRSLARECKGHLMVWGYSAQPELKDWPDYAEYLVQATALKTIAHGFEMTVKTPQGNAELQIALLGRFNVSNVLAVLATLLINNLSLAAAVNKLAVLKPVPGRMETVTAEHGVTVVVDFAHTPKALEAACEAVKQHFDGRFWCVFGCGGDRDRSKRPLMAKVAERYADKVVLTSDNPRSENPQDILAEIATGFEDAAKVKVIADRREAIAYAIAQAKNEPSDKSRRRKNNVVLLAGKGHESVQILSDKTIAFDDRQVAKECLGLAS
jgi:UDP-N-acetylmuramoyl-L-alanyl-D-glutamate--2,6-diaminopimelate ligase